MGSEKFPNQIIEALGVIIDRRPKGILRKKGKFTIEKNGMCSYLI